MAGPNRGTPPDLKLDLKLSLLKEGSSFSFYQAIRLLRHYVTLPPEPGHAADSALDGISIIPNLSLAFPAADLEKIEETGDEKTCRFQVIANFFGLYGTSSPLPTFYTEALMDERADDESASRDFINLINHRLYQLLFRSWMKHRQFQLVVEERDEAHLERLFSILGLGERVFREDIEDPGSLLRYIGLFSQSPRSVLGLKTLLMDALRMPVEIVSCIHRKAKIPLDQRIQLGNPEIKLGQDSFLGEEMDDRMGKFRIKIGPLDEPGYRAFFPGSSLYNKVVLLTDLFVSDPLEYDIDVSMATSQARATCLGGPQWASLGLDTWLFSGDVMEEATNRFYPHQRVQ